MRRTGSSVVSEARSGSEVDKRLLDASIDFLSLALDGIEEGAVNGGLSRDTARAFVRQTVLGTALLLQQRDSSPAELKDQVASPAGTTIAGLAVLEDHAVRGAFIRAMEAAAANTGESRDKGGSHKTENSG